MELDACLGMKNIGKPDAGKLQVRFDEGGLMNEQAGRHVIAACGEALSKSLGCVFGKSVSYSTRLIPV